MGVPRSKSGYSALRFASFVGEYLDAPALDWSLEALALCYGDYVYKLSFLEDVGD